MVQARWSHAFSASAIRSSSISTSSAPCCESPMWKTRYQTSQLECANTTGQIWCSNVSL
jgi:hypothetical protein